MLRTALGALVATGVAVVATPQAATALPSGCTHTYVGASGSWDTASNWSPASVPDSFTAVACVPGGRTVVLSSFRTVNQLHVDGGSIVDVTNQLAFEGTSAQLGGPGRLDVHGTVDLLDAVRLVTNATVNIFNAGEVFVGSDVFISADWGTVTTIGPGGTLEIAGNGGYYQGTPVAGQPLGKLINNGLLRKNGGNNPNVSIIEADYVQGTTGSVSVDCCAVLSFAGHHLFKGQVNPGWGLGTGACGAGTFAICSGSQNPAIDVMSVQLEIPAANPQAANVQLQELTQPPPTTDSRAIGNEVYAHADQLTPDPANPATITLRFSQADVMATPLNEIQVGHISDVSGVMTQTPDCISGTLPPGAPYCVDRATMSRTTQNTFITVLTTQTSRWRVRRTAPGEFAQTAPGAPQGLAAKLAPSDGSGVALTWSQPANDGGAATTAYRVYRDDKLVTTVSGGSAAIMNSGPGEHVFKVRAVNAIGEGTPSTVKVVLDKLSKPRKVTALRGAAGGKLTAGAKWKPPADAGGYAITKYKIAVFKANGKKVDTKVVKAGKLKYLFKLKKARYFFKVKARNTDRWGPWSKPTDVVRPR